MNFELQKIQDFWTQTQHPSILSTLKNYKSPRNYYSFVMNTYFGKNRFIQNFWADL